MCSAFVVFLGLLGLGVFWGSAQEVAAKANLQVAQDAGVEMQTKIDTYQYVLDMQPRSLGSRALGRLGSTEILWDPMRRAIASSLPAGCRYSQWTGRRQRPSDLFSRIRPLSESPTSDRSRLNGQMLQYVRGADLEDALDSVPGLARATVSIVALENQNGVDYYTFEATVRVTALALDNRFGPEWLIEHAQSSASEALKSRVDNADQALADAHAALLAGAPDAASRVTAANGRVHRRRHDYNQYGTLAAAVAPPRRTNSWRPGRRRAGR